MGCCGDKIKGALKNIHGVVNVGHQIVQSKFNQAQRLFFVLPKEKCNIADERMEICRVCEMSTWMTKEKFWSWVEQNGGEEKFFAEIDHLTDWPLLPKQPNARRKRLLCRLCKCPCASKSYVMKAECPGKFWKR